MSLPNSISILDIERGKTMAIIPPNVHIVETATYVAGTSLTLTLTNSTNIGDGDTFIKYSFKKQIRTANFIGQSA